MLAICCLLLQVLVALPALCQQLGPAKINRSHKKPRIFNVRLPSCELRSSWPACLGGEKLAEFYKLPFPGSQFDYMIYRNPKILDDCQIKSVIKKSRLGEFHPENWIPIKNICQENRGTHFF